jgi:hypothetical protein
MERITGIGILLFALAIWLLGFFGVAFIVFPEDSEIVSGVLSFIGSIIGGFITYIGVKMTLEHRNNEKILEQVSEKIFILEDCLKECQVPLNTLFYAQLFDVPSERKNQVYKIQIKTFSEILDKYYKNLRIKLDFNYIHLLSFHVKSINMTASKINDESINEQDLLAGVEKVREIVDSLMKQKSKQIDIYYAVQKKQNDILK